MQSQLFKLCADSLRTFVKENYGIKLKAAHAHELVAAYFGYRTKNSMLADTKYPITNLAQAEIIVMIPDDFIDQRRTNLQELPSDLPDSYTLGEAVYTSLFSDEWWKSQYPPFRSFEKAAIYLAENNDTYQAVFRLSRDIPKHHLVEVALTEDGVLLTVEHYYRTSSGKMLGDGKTTISLQRVAGRIGYGKPQVFVERWSGGARKTLEPLRVQS